MKVKCDWKGGSIKKDEFGLYAYKCECNPGYTGADCSGMQCNVYWINFEHINTNIF